MKRIIKLAPNVSAWCDAKNKIYLTRPNKVSKEIPADIDMTNIEKGVKAGLIRINEVPVQKPVPQVKVEVKIVEPEPVKEDVAEQPKPKKAPRKKKEVEEIPVEPTEKTSNKDK